MWKVLSPKRRILDFFVILWRKCLTKWGGGGGMLEL